MSFSIIYMVMNVGYVAAGYIFDFVRAPGCWHSLFSDSSRRPHQQLFMVSLAIEILIFPAIYFLRRGAMKAARDAKSSVASGSLLGGIAADRAAKCD